MFTLHRICKPCHSLSVVCRGLITEGKKGLNLCWLRMTQFESCCKVDHQHALSKDHTGKVYKIKSLSNCNTISQHQTILPPESRNHQEKICAPEHLSHIVQGGRNQPLSNKSHPVTRSILLSLVRVQLSLLLEFRPLWDVKCFKIFFISAICFLSSSSRKKKKKIFQIVYCVSVKVLA